MYPLSFFNYYRVGRFIFSLALLLAFHMAGPSLRHPALLHILIIYCVIVSIRLFSQSQKINKADFVLDIVFISALMYLTIETFSYLSLLYLFPVFFASVLIQTKKTLLFPLTAAVLYGIVSRFSGLFTLQEGVFNFMLHAFSFFLIALAGDNLKGRMETQDRTIKLLEDERIKMQGYERLFRVSADLAHELRNPLASISAAVQFLREGRRDPDLIEMLGTETKRLTNLVNDFLFFSRPAEAPKEDIDLAEVIRSLLRNQATDKVVVADIGSSVPIIGNRTLLEVALGNIIKNGLEAARTTARVRLIDSSPFLLPGRDRSGAVALEVEDDGPGIDEDVKDKIFEPFFTTKQHGTGLGLAIAYRIITNLGGTTLVDRSSLGGAKFTIIFPAKE